MVRVCEPAPQVLEQPPHPPQSLQPPWMGHECVLQGVSNLPEQLLPPCAGDGLLHERYL